LTGNKNVQIVGAEGSLQSVRFLVYEKIFENIRRKQKGLKVKTFNPF